MLHNLSQSKFQDIPSTCATSNSHCSLTSCAHEQRIYKLNKWTGPRMDEINNTDNIDNTDNTDHFRHVSSCSSCSIVQMLQFSTCNSSCRTKTSCWICSARSCQGTLGITPSQHHHSLSDFPHLFSEWSSRKRIEECLEYSIDLPSPHWGRQKAWTEHRRI